MVKKNVLIVSYYYPPQVTPRSFRTYELVKEFARRNYNVDVFVPDTSEERQKEFENCNIKVVYKQNENNISVKTKKRMFKSGLKSKLKEHIKKIIRYTLGEDIRKVLYQSKLYRKMLKDGKSNYDLIISIGLPFYIHFSTARFIKKTSQRGIKISDYGDPFYLNPVVKKIFYLKHIEKWVLNKFDYITIPTEKSLDYYSFFKKRNYIKVIPQGFDYTSIITSEYSVNKVPTFCYAGNFYESIRNPEYFLEFLVTVKRPFKFFLFTSLEDPFFLQLFEKYKDRLEGKLIIKEPIARDDLMLELSKFDFLVNIENENSLQVPSKLIDYGLSKRPVLSINSKSFSPSTFYEFMDGNYIKATEINLENYNIRRIVDQFESLT